MPNDLGTLFYQLLVMFSPCDCVCVCVSSWQYVVLETPLVAGEHFVRSLYAPATRLWPDFFVSMVMSQQGKMWLTFHRCVVEVKMKLSLKEGVVCPVSTE